MFKLTDLRVEDILQFKTPAAVMTILPEAPLTTAAKMMHEKNVGLLVVADATGAPVGVLSERDIVRRAVVPGKSMSDTPVSAIMTPKPTFTYPTETIPECLMKFNTYHCRHLPVAKPGHPLLGIISERDVMNFLLQKFREENLLIFEELKL
ncbi:MAG: CBS domain-containing protein [Bacteriovoracia bacterium]